MNQVVAHLQPHLSIAVADFMPPDNLVGLPAQVLLDNPVEGGLSEVQSVPPAAAPRLVWLPVFLTLQQSLHNFNIIFSSDSQLPSTFCLSLITEILLIMEEFLESEDVSSRRCLSLWPLVAELSLFLSPFL